MICKQLLYKDWKAFDKAAGWKAAFVVVGIVNAGLIYFFSLLFYFYTLGVFDSYNIRMADDLGLIFAVYAIIMPILLIEFSELSAIKKKAVDLKNGAYLKTYTNKKVSVLNPQPSSIDLADIAHALSLNCRGNGQVPHFYSVAQHSINTAKEAKIRGCSERIQLMALLHDAAEAYITDLIRPVKQLMPLFDEIENRYLEAIYTHFEIGKVTVEEWKTVKEIDDALLEYDVAVLLGEPEPEDGYKFKIEPDVACRDPKEVEAEFIQLAESLIEKMIDDKEKNVR